MQKKEVIQRPFELHYKQGQALTSKATEILYGGAAGGGKSHLMRIAAILWCIQIPRLQVYLFRRIREDLVKNHIEGEYGFRSLLSDHVNQGWVTIVEDEIRFNENGSRIYLCHCKDEKDRFKYDGAEMHVLLIDELTHFTEVIYTYLRSRVRMNEDVRRALAPEYQGCFPRILTGSNPGKLGHAWVKRTFVELLDPMEIRKMPKEEGGMLRQYIPALLEDNPSLDKDDYEGKLFGLGSPELVKAMRFGLWDITAGAALEKLNRNLHMVRSFRVPEHWTKLTGLDWGTARPYALAWGCVVEENMILKGKDPWPDKFIPKGAIIIYREKYGWNGKANEGCRKESPVVAKEAVEIEEDAGEDINYRVGDPAMWSSHDGPCVAERMYNSTDGRFSMEKAHNDRISGYEEFRARLVGEDGVPMVYFTENCKHIWRTLPDLQLDEDHPEKGPDSDQEDHLYDCIRYMLCSRPYITTNKQWLKEKYENAKRKFKGKHKVFY